MFPQIKTSREATLIGTALIFLGVAVYYDRKSHFPVSVSTLRRPNAGSLNFLDAMAFKVPDPRAAAQADVGLYGGPTLPLLLSLHPRVRPHYPAILLIWFETILLNFALTSAIKNRFSRPRPYVLNEEFPYRQPLSRNDRAAFLSGHASMATAGSTLFALLLQHYVRHPAIYLGSWFLAAALSGFTAYQRVKSAKHWPSDAVAGMLLGLIVGSLVFQIHRKKTAKNSIPETFQPSFGITSPATETPVVAFP